jgi:type I restriction enzyme M protein
VAINTWTDRFPSLSTRPHWHRGIFSKGNISSDPIKIDAVLFTDSSWIDLYRRYRTFRDPDSLQHLRELAIGVIEFKRGGKKIEQVFNSQIRAAIKEPDVTFVLGAYYDTRRLYLFKKVDGIISRLDNSRNFPNSQRVSERFQLEITDPYFYFPSHLELLKLNEGAASQPLAARRIEHLDVIYPYTMRGLKAL